MTTVNGVVDLRLDDHAELASPGGMVAITPAGVRDPILVMRLENDEFVVLSLRCPHLGCTVRWDNEAQHLVCPCHLSTFDDRGSPTKGPAKTALQAYRWNLMGSQLRIAVEQG